MRQDLKKQLCEHERARSWDSFTNYRHLRQVNADEHRVHQDDDEVFIGASSGHRESMKKRYGYDTKSFGENLSPLEGIVRKSEGKQWDKVYAEICKVAGDRSSTTGAHIFQHLFDYIETGTYFDEDGDLYYVDRKYGGTPRPISGGAEFYVHPTTGCITRNKARKPYRTIQRERTAEREKEALKVRRVISSELELHNIEGVWYEVQYVTREPVVEYYDDYVNYQGFSSAVNRPKHKIRKSRLVYQPMYDVLLKVSCHSNRRVAISKRTLSYKQLKQFDLLV